MPSFTHRIDVALARKERGPMIRETCPARVVLRNRFDKTPEGAVRVMRPSDSGNPFHFRAFSYPDEPTWHVVQWRGRRIADPAPIPEWVCESFRFLHRDHAHNCAVTLYNR
jgi:hypothetical protein